MSSELGNNLRVSIFGQSHAEAIGVSIDGLPAGEKIDLEELYAFLQRRAPGWISPLPAGRRTGPGFCAACWTVIPAELPLPP